MVVDCFVSFILCLLTSVAFVDEYVSVVLLFLINNFLSIVMQIIVLFD